MSGARLPTYPKLHAAHPVLDGDAEGCEPVEGRLGDGLAPGPPARTAGLVRHGGVQRHVLVGRGHRRAVIAHHRHLEHSNANRTSYICTHFYSEIQMNSELCQIDILLVLGLSSLPQEMLSY
jgi:hypothetical protein